MDPPTKKARVADVTTDLDPNGDMYIVLKDADLPTLRYKVSSQILSFASPFFKVLLGPHFREGHALRTQSHPDITLEEDDQGSMDTILRFLHFRGHEVPIDPEPSDIAKLVIQCDKYDLINAMLPVIQLWCSVWCTEQNLCDQEAIGLMVLATWMTKSKLLPKVLMIAVRNLEPGFEEMWAEHDTLKQMDPAAPGFLLEEISKAKRLIVNTMEQRADKLADAEEDRSCLASDLNPRPRPRMASLVISELRQCGLWPAAESCERHTITAFLYKMPRKPADHSCTTGDPCSLRKQINSVKDKAARLTNNYLRELALQAKQITYKHV